jgi:hypothetical protein
MCVSGFFVWFASLRLVVGTAKAARDQTAERGNGDTLDNQLRVSLPLDQPKPAYRFALSSNRSKMRSHFDIDQVRIDHSSLITGMDSFYHRLVELDYLREEEVQFPPHTGEGKVPLAVTSIQSAAGRGLFHSNEECITLLSRPVSHLQKEDQPFEEGERFFGYADEGEMPPLPRWAILLFTGAHPSQNIVVYDTRNSMDFQNEHKSCDLT